MRFRKSPKKSPPVWVFSPGFPSPPFRWIPLDSMVISAELLRNCKPVKEKVAICDLLHGLGGQALDRTMSLTWISSFVSGRGRCLRSVNIELQYKLYQTTAIVRACKHCWWWRVEFISWSASRLLKLQGRSWELSVGQISAGHSQSSQAHANVWCSLIFIDFWVRGGIDL